jgi:hypothetical protein
MYIMYDRSRTYDVSDDIRVIYGQAIRVRIIRFLCTTVRLRQDDHCTMVQTLRGSYVIWYE